MTGVTAKIAKAHDAVERQRFQRAENLLKLEKERVDLEGLITKDKEWFRDEAAGETLVQVVPGSGQVMVKKGSEAKPGGATVHVFNETNFLALPIGEQKKLIKLGVITVGKIAPTKAGTPSVCITLNK